jgi:hypothetical protein
MRYRDECGEGRTTHLDVRAHDAAAAALLAPWLRYADDDDDAADDGAQETPRITLVFGAETDAPILDAQADDGRTLVLRAPQTRDLGDAPLRRASVEEALALGLSWALGVDRVGCFDPHETLFREGLTEAEAWVLDLRHGVDAALAAVAAISALPRVHGIVQIWCGAGLPRPRDVESLSRAFGADDTDAWAVLDTSAPLPGRAAHPHVLLATLVVAAPCPSG